MAKFRNPRRLRRPHFTHSPYHAPVRHGGLHLMTLVRAGRACGRVWWDNWILHMYGVPQSEDCCIRIKPLFDALDNNPFEAHIFPYLGCREVHVEICGVRADLEPQDAKALLHWVANVETPRRTAVANALRDALQALADTPAIR